MANGCSSTFKQNKQHHTATGYSKQSRALTINHGKEVLSSCSSINQQQNKTA
jgi:hypothetical protein